MTFVDRNRMATHGFVDDVDDNEVVLTELKPSGRLIDQVAIRIASLMRIEMRGPVETEIHDLFHKLKSVGIVG